MKTKKILHCVLVKIWVELDPNEDQEACEVIENDMSFTRPIWEKIKDISYSENVSLAREVKK